VIVVPWNRALRDRIGLELIPFPDGRALIAFDRLSASEIELRLAHALADPTPIGEDRPLFETSSKRSSSFGPAPPPSVSLTTRSLSSYRGRRRQGG
jgi:hypothetical protein